MFGAARPAAVVVTTPNAEYNVRCESLAAGHDAAPRPPLRVDARRSSAPGPTRVAERVRLRRRVPARRRRRPRGRARRPSWRVLHAASRTSAHDRAMRSDAISRARAVPRRAWSASSGSGKSTFARKHFGRHEVISSDFCRGLVADDENDQAATDDAFDVLHYIAGKRLAAGRLTVVDATNVQPDARKQLVDAGPRARRAARRDRPRRARAACASSATPRGPTGDFGRAASSGASATSCAGRCGSLGSARASARSTCCAASRRSTAADDRPRAAAQRPARTSTGPFDIIGDVHGCRSELETLLGELGYALVRDDAGARSTPYTPRAARPSSSATSSTAARTPPACCAS